MHLKNYFIKGTFLSLYFIVMAISLWSSVSFFMISHSNGVMGWALAIAFEIGQAGCLISVLMGKDNSKGLALGMMTILTLFQAMANTYFAYIHANQAEVINWCQLFWLDDLELIDKKRIVSFISGAALPLVALGFIHLLTNIELKDGSEINNNVPPLEKQDEEEGKDTAEEPVKTETEPAEAADTDAAPTEAEPVMAQDPVMDTRPLDTDERTDDPGNSKEQLEEVQDQAEVETDPPVPEKVEQPDIKVEKKEEVKPQMVDKVKKPADVRLKRKAFRRT